MQQLLNDLLEYVNVAATELSLENVSLQDAVREALAPLRADIGAKNAAVTVQESLPPIMGHRDTVVVLVNNLVSNALKFVAPNVRPKSASGPRARVPASAFPSRTTASASSQETWTGSLRPSSVSTPKAPIQEPGWDWRLSGKAPGAWVRAREWNPNPQTAAGSGSSSKPLDRGDGDYLQVVQDQDIVLGNKTQASGDLFPVPKITRVGPNAGRLHPIGSDVGKEECHQTQHIVHKHITWQEQEHSRISGPTKAGTGTLGAVHAIALSQH